MESNAQLTWAYSNKRQSAYATPNPNVDLNQSHPFESADFGEHTPNMSDNAAQFGKGHEFASRLEILSWDTKFKRSHQATTKMLAWAFAFHTGKDIVSSLGGGAYSHTFEFQDPIGTGYYGSGRQQPVMTIVERTTSGQVRKFPSMQVKSVEVTGALNDWLKLSMELQGSGKKTDVVPTSGFSFPDCVEGVLLRNASMTMEVGPSGATEAISCDVRSFRFRSEMSYDENSGYCPGSGYQGATPHTGQVRSKLEFTKRAVMFEFVVNATRENGVGGFFETLEEANEVVAHLTVVGDEVSSGHAHTWELEITKLKYRTVAIGADGDTVTYAVAGVVMWDADLGVNTEIPGNPYTVTVINDVPLYLASS